MVKFRPESNHEDRVRLEKPSMGNSKLVIYCSPQDLRRDYLHLRAEILKQSRQSNTHRPKSSAAENFGGRLSQQLTAATKAHFGAHQAPVTHVSAAPSGSSLAPNTRSQLRRVRPRTVGAPDPTPTSAFHGMDVGRVKRGLLQPRSSTRRLATSADLLQLEHIDPVVLSALKRIQSLLDRKGFRVVDLLKRDEYNVSVKHVDIGDRDLVRGPYLEEAGDNTLDAREFSIILRDTDESFSQEEISRLIRFLDKDNNKEVDAMELENALRRVRAMNVSTAHLDAQVQAKRQSMRLHAAHAHQQRQVPALPAMPSAENNRKTLQELGQRLRLRRTRLQDLYAKNQRLLPVAKVLSALRRLQIPTGPAEEALLTGLADSRGRVDVQILDQHITGAMQSDRPKGDALMRISNLIQKAQRVDPTASLKAQALRAEILHARQRRGKR